jgi:hypothetical protein
MFPEDLTARNPLWEFLVVALEALILGMLALAGLTWGRGRGDCGSVCRAARPYLVIALGFCALALVGLVIAWMLGRSGRLFQPERIAFRIGAGLAAIDLGLLLAVMLIPGVHAD